jgi:hypothetical protein
VPPTPTENPSSVSKRLNELDSKAAQIKAQGQSRPPINPIDAFQLGGGIPIPEKKWTGPEVIKAFRDGVLSNEDIKRLIDAGRLEQNPVSRDPGVTYHRWI